MLVYHPSFDIYHTAYRILKILYDNRNIEIEKDRMRIIDFILLFPQELNNFRVPQNASKFKNLYKITTYNKIPDKNRVFQQTRSFYEISLQCLTSRDLLDLDQYKQGILKLNLTSIDDGLKTELSRTDLIDQTILKIIYDHFIKLPTKDLIERTSLVDNKYAIYKNQ
ncbi:ABC-three component system middle component 5 [Siphonobacter curvatus]|uniref:Uncharacterized protein n=1 Tax=Siphonobacter curvatus TaxID=2094562 RepID=A0A2S7IQ59_9BACT|nr:ABC-three component system middle component 5 [Siphonobacter curvatus]PQA59845.1 hypothetical protein C5O19_09545 [Siphonobacter curvatus]